MPDRTVNYMYPGREKEAPIIHEEKLAAVFLTGRLSLSVKG